MPGRRSIRSSRRTRPRTTTSAVPSSVAAADAGSKTVTPPEAGRARPATRNAPARRPRRWSRRLQCLRGRRVPGSRQLGGVESGEAGPAETRRMMRARPSYAQCDMGTKTRSRLRRPSAPSGRRTTNTTGVSPSAWSATQPERVVDRRADVAVGGGEEAGHADRPAQPALDDAGHQAASRSSGTSTSTGACSRPRTASARATSRRHSAASCQPKTIAIAPKATTMSRARGGPPCLHPAPPGVNGPLRTAPAA
jgi:hypothetical protein